MPANKKQYPDTNQGGKKTKAAPVVSKKQKVPAKKKIVPTILPVMPLLEI